MQEDILIQDHLLFKIAYEMVVDKNASEEYNFCSAEQWLTGEKKYFNGLTPLDLYNSGKEGRAKVLTFMYNLSKSHEWGYV